MRSYKYFPHLIGSFQTRLMNQRNIAKSSKDASSSPVSVQNQSQSQPLQTRLYKGSIDCGIQVGIIAADWQLLSGD